LGPEANDSLTATRLNFIDQQRFTLPNGDYALELSIKDEIAKGAPYKSSFPIKVNYGTDVQISDIELLESYKKSEQTSELSKSGYDLVPYTSDILPQNMDKLRFYAEVYNTNEKLGKDAGLLVGVYLQNNGNRINSLSRITREKSEHVIPILRELSIAELPTGNYELAIEVRNAQNELLTDKKLYFQRSNPRFTPQDSSSTAKKIKKDFIDELPKDSLKECLRSLWALSTTTDWQAIKNVIKTDSVPLMRQTLFNFWATQNPSQPEEAFKAYMQNVKAVNKEFSMYGVKGYMTDRGRVYLKYGPPNSLDRYAMERDSYPYQIWQYNKVNGQTNRKFVFFSPEQSNNNYKLLHSDARGEFFNERWKYELQRQVKTNYDERGNDPSTGTDPIDSRSDDRFRNPR
jgi:GWxTD domain-containing protein